MIMRDIKFVVCLSVCLSVCLFGMRLPQNCVTDLAEILHKEGSLSRSVRLKFWRRSPRGSRQGSRKCYHGRYIMSVSYWSTCFTYVDLSQRLQTDVVHNIPEKQRSITSI